MNILSSCYFTSVYLCASLIGLNAAEKGNHLFILSGQSNMAALDPRISFTPTVEAAFGAENVTVVHDALGGQPIRRWYKDWKPAQGDEPKAKGDLYDRLMKKVEVASAGKEFSSVTFLWMQGERDAREQHGEVYLASFKGLVKQIEGDLGRDDVNFVIGRLSDFDMANAKYPHWTMVRDVQVAIAEADSRGAWVDTDDLNDGLNKKGRNITNDLHYSVEGYRIFGERLANEAIAQINEGGSRSMTKVSKKAQIEVDPILTEERPTIRLWPIKEVGGEANRLKFDNTYRGKLRFENVKDPHMTVFPSDRSEPSPAVIYCPGGGYKHLTPKPELLKWLNESGVTVFMLKYTVPHDREAAIKDLQRAMRLVRHNATQWNIDPEQLGVIGSSAGGHLVARLSQNYDKPYYAAADTADKQSAEPNFVVLMSSAYFFKKEGKETTTEFDEVFHMQGKIAPTFLVYAKDDHNFYLGGIAYEKALKATGIETHLVISETGGHGLKDVVWYPECREWLEGHGINLISKK